MADEIKLNPTQFNTLKDILTALSGVSKSLNKISGPVTKHVQQQVDDFGNSVEDSSDTLSNFNQNVADASDAAKDQGKSTEQLIRQNSKLNRAYGSHYEYVKNVGDALGQFEKFMGSSNKSLMGQSAVLSGLTEAYGMNNAAADKFADKLLDVANGTQYKKLLDVMQEEDEARKTSLNSLRELDEAQTKLMKSAEFFRKAMQLDNDLPNTIKRVMATQDSQLDVGDKLLKQLAIKHGLENASIDDIKNHINVSEDLIKHLSKEAYWEQKKHDIEQGFYDRFGVIGKALFGKAGPIILAAAALDFFAKAVFGSVKQQMLFNEAGIGESFINLKQAQMGLLLSAEDLTKVFGENRRELTTIGFADFTKAIDTTQKELFNYGIKFAEGAKFASSSIKEGIALGIDSKDRNNLDKSMKLQTQAFLDLRSITSVSAEEFQSFQDEMANSTTVQALMNSTNQKDRITRMQEMNSLRDDFATLGLSAQDAQKALMSMKELGNEKLSDRFNIAAQLAAALSASGMKESAEMNKLIQLGNRKTPEQEKRVMVLLSQAQGIADKLSLGSYSDESRSNVINEMLEKVQPLVEASRKATLTSAATGGPKTNAEKAQDKKNQEVGPAMKAVATAEAAYEVITNDLPVLNTIKFILLGIAAILGASGLAKGLGSWTLGKAKDAWIGKLGTGAIKTIEKTATEAAVTAAERTGVKVAENTAVNIATRGVAGTAATAAGGAISGLILPATLTAAAGKLLYDAYDDVQKKKEAKNNGGPMPEKTWENDWATLGNNLTFGLFKDKDKQSEIKQPTTAMPTAQPVPVISTPEKPKTTEESTKNNQENPNTTSTVKTPLSAEQSLGLVIESLLRLEGINTTIQENSDIQLKLLTALVDVNKQAKDDFLKHNQGTKLFDRTDYANPKATFSRAS